MLTHSAGTLDRAQAGGLVLLPFLEHLRPAAWDALVTALETRSHSVEVPRNMGDALQAGTTVSTPVEATVWGVYGKVRCS